MTYRMNTPDSSKLDVGPVLDCPGCEVLLVEDGDLNRIIARELLSRRGVHVVVASSGPEALAHLAARSFDAVLMDVHMPGMDGLQTTRAIRTSGAVWASLPVIAMTAATSSSDIDRCLAGGMNAHVGKPIDTRQLMRVLARFVQPARSAERDVSSTPVVQAQLVHAQPPASRPPQRQLPAEVPGIVVSEGCSRVRNNEAAYLDILEMFQRRYADASSILGDPAAVQEPRLLELAHSLISTAALVGANTLSALAGELQARLAVSDHEAAGSLTQRVVAELSLVLSSACLLLSIPADPPSTEVQGALGEPGSF
jgi:two-component system sensor histidine kinase/response regulator